MSQSVSQSVTREVKLDHRPNTTTELRGNFLSLNHVIPLKEEVKPHTHTHLNTHSAAAAVDVDKSILLLLQLKTFLKKKNLFRV